MRLHVLAVGERIPAWAFEACADYQKRFPPHSPLRIIAVPAPRRGRNPDVTRLREQEFRALAARTPKNAFTVALDETGDACTTDRLARRLEAWMHQETDVTFWIGGPDGLAPAARRSARQVWSLSPLTLPHALARVVVVEQLYRALCVLDDHPYHRA